MTVTARWSLTAALLVSLVGAGCFGHPQEEQTSSATDSSQTEQATEESAARMPVAPASSTTQTATSTAQKEAPTPTAPTKPKSPTTTPIAKTVVVTITNGKFSPQMVAVNAGDTVMWINKDTLPHTSKSDGSLLWDSGTIRPGGTYKRVFPQPGSYNYSCGITPNLKGTVIVH